MVTGTSVLNVKADPDLVMMVDSYVDEDSPDVGLQN
jgi:hypothetical protein